MLFSRSSSAKEIPTYSLKTLLSDVREGRLDDIADTLKHVGAFTVTDVTAKDRLDEEMKNLRRDAARCFQVRVWNFLQPILLCIVEIRVII